MKCEVAPCNAFRAGALGKIIHNAFVIWKTSKKGMQMANNEKKKAKLEYPCLWAYKIIGPDKEEMHSAVAEIIRDCKYKISPSRSSETGKYHCLNVELTVTSDAQRTSLYEALKAHRAVKMVL